MSSFIILGTDTGAGKTTFAALWMAAFSNQYAYWKPLETGEADSACMRRLVPRAEIAPALMSFTRPVAPLLAAREQGMYIPSARDLAQRAPVSPHRELVVETFGSPFSPLNETELQTELIRSLNMPAILVCSSTVGVIGRTVPCVRSLDALGLRPAAIVIVGTRDPFAEEQLARWTNLPVVSIEMPLTLDASGVAAGAAAQQHALTSLKTLVDESPTAARDLTAILAADGRYVWHPYTSLRDSDPPMPVIAAEGEFLHLADGRRMIDGISSWWTILYGHRHEPLMAALAEAMQRIDHIQFAGVTHPWAVDLAQMLVDSVHMPGGRVFYSDNGSTAVEVALKMAYQYWAHRREPQRTLFFGFEHGYHGDTFGAMAVGRDPVFFGTFEPLLFRAESVPLDANRLHEVLVRNRGRVAAVIIEPLVQGAGGMRMHSPQALHDIFEVTRRHDTLFIADEVMTGGGRLGPRWAHLATDIQPDLICAAKTLAGGILPLAATLAAAPIVAAFDTADRRRTFFHGHSFTAHPLACAVAAANWRSMPPDQAAARRIEAFWNRTLVPLRGNPRVRDVRLCGSIGVLELAADDGYLADIGRRMRQRCLDLNVSLRPLGNVLYAMPPLCVSDQSLARIVEAMKSAIEV